MNVRNVPLERLRNVPRAKKISGFFKCYKAMFFERLKDLLKELFAGKFRENSQITFLEHFVETFREHCSGTLKLGHFLSCRNVP